MSDNIRVVLQLWAERKIKMKMKVAKPKEADVSLMYFELLFLAIVENK